MTSFQPKNYSPSLRRLLPEGYKLKNDSRLLLCSIMHEINQTFVKACLAKNGKYEVISPKSVQESVKRFIPNDLRKYAFAAGSNEIFEYSTGLLKFREPKSVDVGADEDKLLRKALTRLASAAQPELPLSKKCTTIMGVIKHLMAYFVEETAECINDDNEQSLQNMRRKLEGILGQELFQHAEGHAHKNLEWYKQDLLHYPIKTAPSKESKEIKAVSEEDKFLFPNIQRLAKSQKRGIPKDAAFKISMTLREVLSKMVKEANQMTASEEESPSVTAGDMQEILKKLFPQKVYRNALAQARANTMNYSCGYLKYDDGKTEEKESVEEVVPKKPEKLYFQSAVVPLMKAANCTAGKETVNYVDEILNDIVEVLVEKCSNQNNNIIDEDKVIAAVNELLPEELKNHALSRLMYIKSCISHPSTKISEHASSEQLPKRVQEQPKSSEQLPKTVQEQPKSSEQLPKMVQEQPKSSQQLPKTSLEQPESSQQLSKRSDSLPRVSRLLSNITQLLPSMSQLLPFSSPVQPKTSEQLADDSPLSDSPTSEELISKPQSDIKLPSDSSEDESATGISMEEASMKNDEDSMKNDEDSMKNDEVNMETDIEIPAEESSTKMEQPPSPVPSMEDQKGVGENKQSDGMDTGSQEDKVEDKASFEKEKNDFPLPSEEDLNNVNDNDQLKRENGQENGMSKNGIGSKSKESPVDRNGKHTNKNRQGDLFLNFPKNSYWLDVRPYEFFK